MTKIKFSCPGCNAKLKVPESLAGVAGPCPKCGGTIVAPLQSEDEPVKPSPAPRETGNPVSESIPQVRVQQQALPTPASEFPPPLEQKPERVAPPEIRQPVQPRPAVFQQPGAQKPVVAPPLIQQPVVQQQPVQPRPTIQPPFSQQSQPSARSNQVGFPRPLEQVSQTAKFALANSPANYPHGQASPTYPPRPAGESPTHPHSRSAHNFSSQTPRQPDPSDLIPEDIFEEQPEQAHASVGAHTSTAYGPHTQPIVVKKREEAQVSANSAKAQGMPRLDVSLGESGNGSLSTGQSASRSEPTVIQLPEVGSNRPDKFSINRPEPASEPGSYRPPNPVALTPPGGHPETHFEEDTHREATPPVFEELEPDYSSYQVEPEFPIEETGVEYEYMDDSDLPESGEGSVAAFLAEAMDSSLEGDRNAMSGKTKDEILDELLGVVPKSRKKKKGLSASTKFMLSVLAAVAVCAGIGVYYAIDKLGGFSMAGDNVFGEEGLRNLKQKSGLKKITLPTEKVPELEVDPDAPAIPAPPTDGLTPPDKIDIDKLVEGVVGSGELESSMAARIGLDPKNEIPPPVEEKVAVAEPSVVPPAAITPIKPAPSPLPPLEKENYNPPPFFPAPGPDDPPLKNTHDLVDAFMRAPNWEARIPYIYGGESLRAGIESYYQSWPDFSLDRFKMKLFQMELEKEFGGPFWVYQITRSDADPGGVPMILRVENGNLKVDWQVFAEFSDQHFVKFREGKIIAPHTFRLVAERVSEYPGPDRPGFTDLNDFLCFELNPPYGGYRAYSEYAFVKKGTEVAKKLDEKISLGDDPLAVILTLDRQNFKHGIRHYVITDFVDEGWFN